MISVKEISKIQDKKYTTHSIAFLPSLAVVSLTQDSKTLMETTVQKGDYVQEGQIIAKNIVQNNSENKKNYSYPAFIHSPVPGKVLDIYNVINPNGKKLPAVLIKMEGNFSFSGKKREVLNWAYSQGNTRIKTISQMGIINTFEKPTSLAQQIDTVLKNKEKNLAEQIPPLVVRLFDSDPDTVVDQYITENFAKEVFEGTAILAETLNTKDVVFVTEKDAWNLPEEETKKIFKNIQVHILETDINVYPRGQYKYIKQNTLQYLSTKGIDCYKEIFPVDSTTCLDVYNAIAKSYPAIDRFVQIEGDDIATNGIFKIRIGSTLRNIFEECGGFFKEPAKIIINGLIGGMAVSDLDTPITRYVKSIFVLSSRGFPDQRQTTCVRCGRCHNICPENIHPEKIYSNYYSDTPVKQYILDTIKLCTECGLCNAVCPSRIPLYQTIQLIKDFSNE